MQLRVARHTTNLAPLIEFYTQNLGLKILGSFEGHDGYDGVFLGLENMPWHLEFTTSALPPQHQPDEDDLLVFYASDKAAFEQLKANFERNGIAPIEPQNPYWKKQSLTYSDPDGYRLVISLR